MEIQRIDALRKLENATIATTANAVLEQSNAFIFHNGELVTFDGEICARQESPFGTEIEGAIIAGDFLKMLQRFPDDTLRLEMRNGEIVMKGKRRQSGVKMMADIALPFDDIPVPEKFIKMPEGLQEALVAAAQVCGKDETAPKTTHIHVAPDRVESTDSFRVFRADVATKMKKPVLVHALSVVRSCKHKLTHMALSSREGWFHVKTEEGMILSMLCAADTYYEKSMIDSLLSVAGEMVTLPSNLADILSRAEVMDTPTLSIGQWDSQVTISLSDNALRVTSRKEEGWFKEVKKVSYEGPEMTFTIHPAFLKDLVSRTRKVVISERQIKVEVDNMHFTASLESKQED